MVSSQHQDLTPTYALLLAVRFLLELAALAALAWWGVRTGDSALAKVLLGTGAPLAMAVVWGAFIAPKASFDVSGPVHVALQLAVLVAAVAALASIDQTVAAGLFAVAAVANGVALYALGR